MKHVLAFLFAAATLGLVVLGGGFFYVKSQAFDPGPHAASTRVVVEPGMGVAAIAARLSARGVIEDPLIFKLWARATDRHRRLRAGEFEVPARASVDTVLDQLVNGKTVVRKLTLPEGLTVTEALILVQDAEGLTGPITAIPDEGWLLPETYHYSWGDERVDMILNMSVAMEDAVRETWAKRPEDTPLASPAELLTLASIVEKETAVPEGFANGLDLKGWCDNMDMDDIHWGLCVGSITAAHDVVMTYQQAGATNRVVCTPDGVTRGDAVYAVIGYLRENPDELQYSLGDVVVSALAEKFPCR